MVCRNFVHGEKEGKAGRAPAREDQALGGT
jgi:hypothetical protein